MTVIIYTENESTGALKQIAEIEGIDDGPLAVDALLDEMPRLKDREFVVVTGTLEDGVVERISIPDEEAPIVQPRRIMVRSRGGEEATAPAKRTARRTTAKKTAAAAPAAAKKAPAKRAASTAKKTGGRPAGKKAPAKKTGTKAASKPAGSAPAKTVVKEVSTPKKSPISSSGRASGRANSASAAASAGKKSPFGRNAASDE